MAKKLGKLFTLAVTAGTAAAAAYYYLQNKKAAVQEAPEEEDDFEKDPEDDFDDTDFTDDDFVDESEHPEEAKEEAKEDTPVFSSETKEDGHTYVTLDLKAAQDKAVQLRDTVFNKVGDTVSRIKNSSEYETVTGKINETVDKVRSNEDVQAVDNVTEAEDQTAGNNCGDQGSEDLCQSGHDALQRVLILLGCGLSLVFADAFDAGNGGEVVVEVSNSVANDDLELASLGEAALNGRDSLDGFDVCQCGIIQNEAHSGHAVADCCDVFLATNQLQQLAASWVYLPMIVVPPVYFLF